MHTSTRKSKPSVHSLAISSGPHAPTYKSPTWQGCHASGACQFTDITYHLKKAYTAEEHSHVGADLLKQRSKKSRHSGEIFSGMGGGPLLLAIWKRADTCMSTHFHAVERLYNQLYQIVTSFFAYNIGDNQDISILWDNQFIALMMSLGVQCY